MKFLLRTFGEIALLNSDEHQIAFPKKALLIIAYLLVSDSKSVSRTNMARFLWGEGDLANSLTNLRKLVSRIKSRQWDLNVELLTFDDTDIHIANDSLTSDIVPTRVSTIGNPAEHLRTLMERSQLKFLERANCQTRAFIDWRESERRRHLAMLKEALDAAVTIPVASDDIALIKEAALLLFEAEPQDETARRILLKAFDAEGGIDQLKRIFARRKDLVSPWPATLAASSRSPTPVAPAHSPAISEQDTATQPVLRIPRLALLPPGNDGPDGTATMIVSSLIEDITLGFCALYSLRVIAPYSTVQIDRQAEDQAALLERYDINYVLETRLSGPDDDLSLVTQLISLPGSEILWAERFNFGTLDLACNKREISRQIVLAAAAEVERHEMARAYFEDNPVPDHQYLVGALDYIGRMIDPSLADRRLAAASLAMLGHQNEARTLVRRVRGANPDFDADRWQSLIPSKEQWHTDPYREGLKKREV
ncbi:hypothetical protein [Rhizobium sp. CNPSo 4039]|uniref:hypothetical protein n=1 Tax=Rhizobium sp. CNPSo 4039 TaxID=3021409 RepID=UPI00254FB188|nr:hypothetical protein [Rhizobium sp. CNPSo 4039]MDK4711810.1 hypothetical protein [Rhizobium sp. CNPSo 4039]